MNNNKKWLWEQGHSLTDSWIEGMATAKNFRGQLIITAYSGYTTANSNIAIDDLSITEGQCNDVGERL